MKTYIAIFAAVALYLIMFILTYGHAYANEPRSRGVMDMHEEASFFRALGWPLYWSAVYFERSASECEKN